MGESVADLTWRHNSCLLQSVTKMRNRMKSRYFSIFILSLLLIPFSSWANDNLDLGIPSRDGQLVDRTGYAFLYSERHEQPLWVSYKLTKAEVQNKVAKRKDNFRLDPAIKTGSAILADYKGSGYDRGHLAPAGDMAWSKGSIGFCRKLAISIEIW